MLDRRDRRQMARPVLIDRFVGGERIRLDLDRRRRIGEGRLPRRRRVGERRLPRRRRVGEGRLPRRRRAWSGFAIEQGRRRRRRALPGVAVLRGAHRRRENVEATNQSADRQRHDARAQRQRSAEGVEKADLGGQQIVAADEPARSGDDEKEPENEGENRHFLSNPVNMSKKRRRGGALAGERPCCEAPDDGLTMRARASGVAHFARNPRTPSFKEPRR